MTTNIDWLHLTDLHRGVKEGNYLWPGVKEIVFEDLKRLRDICGPWDFVLFTGDLTQAGTSEDFQRATEFLEELWQHFSSLGCTPMLLAIPGNHDLHRPTQEERKRPCVKLLLQWEQQIDVQREFWEEPASEYRKFISEIFGNYQIWWEGCPFKPANVTHGSLPGDFSVTIEKNGVKFGVVGLNSSFLQISEDNFQGKLAVHPRQFHDVCENDGPAWIRRHQACLLLTHHPPSWLNPVSQRELCEEINAYGRFAVHLCGHMHDTAFREIGEGGNEIRRLWQGRSLFGLEYYGKLQEGKRLHGYSGGRIELSRNTGRLLFWPREARLQGNQRRIVPDYSLDLTDEHHTLAKEVSLLQPALNGYSTKTNGIGDLDGQDSRIGRFASNTEESSAPIIDLLSTIDKADLPDLSRTVVSDPSELKDSRFLFGRNRALRSIFRKLIVSKDNIRIQGPIFCGKTSILNALGSAEIHCWCKDIFNFKNICFAYVNLRSVRSPEEFFRDVLTSIMSAYPDVVYDGNEFIGMLEYFKKVGKRVVLLMNNYDSILEKQSFEKEFFNFLRSHSGKGVLTIAFTNTFGRALSKEALEKSHYFYASAHSVWYLPNECIEDFVVVPLELMRLKDVKKFY